MFAHPCNLYPSQDIQNSRVPSQCICPSDFYPHRLVLPVLELHMNGIIWYILFCPYMCASIFGL